MEELANQREELRLLLFHHGAEPRDVHKIKDMSSKLPRTQKIIFKYTSYMSRIRTQLFFVERAIGDPNNVEEATRVLYMTRLVLDHFSAFLQTCKQEAQEAN
jgi:hypothetical protein